MYKIILFLAWVVGVVAISTLPWLLLVPLSVVWGYLCGKALVSLD